jgi:hypothetical protein
MKKISIVWLLLCSIIGGVSAQNIELKSRVREAGSNEALAFVNVVLQTPDSAFVAGAVSDGGGKFVIPGIKPGDYRLALSCIGYVTQYIALEGLKAGVTLPDILMEEESVGLEAVTVTGSAVTSRIDRKLVFPTERQIKASSNGVDLLQQLMLPRLQVDALTRAVGVTGGGEVQLRINGVKVEIDEIVALQPEDIIRVEYHDNPGLRYGNAAAVVDYIVRRQETGGNLGVNIWNGFKLKEFGNNSVNGRINHKKSEFSFNYSVNHRDASQMWRDNEETFRPADGSVFRRREEGEPGRWQMGWQYLNTAYGYMSDKRMFNAAFRYFANNDPHTDYSGKLYNMANPNDYVQMSDRNKERTFRPALDLYYQENLKNDQILVLNLVGTYNYTDNSRIYTESRDGAYLTDISNLVTGNKYSWIGEGIYEKKFDGNSLSAGLRHTQAYADNTYRNGHEYNTEMQQGETFAYAEWKGKVKKLDYTLGAGFTRSSFRQNAEGIDYNRWTFNPRLALFLPLPANASLRLTSRIGNNLPSLSELSAVEQVIDSFQIQRGNPGLKPYFRYENVLAYEWQKGIVRINVQGKYEYLPSAVMEEKFREGGRIVQTRANQKSWQNMGATADLRVGPVKDILTVTLNGGVNHYISHGNTYRHVYTNPFLYATVTAGYKNFQALFTWNILTSNHFYGETMNGGERIHGFFIDYKHRNMSFGIGGFNPFVNNYRIDRENRSEYASYKRSQYVNNLSRMFMFRFSYNIDFGRTFRSAQKRLNNADNDAGVMKAGK